MDGSSELRKKLKFLCFFIIINNASLLKTWICLHFITFFPSQGQLDSSGQGHSTINAQSNDEEPRFGELSF